MDEEAYVPGVLGIHFEGPHLNPERTGVHDRTQIRPCNDADLADLTHLCDLVTGCTLVTLAPECVPLAAISTLAQRGAVIAAGHTMAGPDDLAAAIDAGLTGVTHLFNAMAPMGSRAPGTVGGALADDRLWCSIIADGHHVHPASVAAAWRAKPAGKLLLVSDAMGPVGSMEPAPFTLGDEAVQVGDGRCITADGRLAGSLLSMDAAVRYCVNTLSIGLDEALRMAATYPARAINQGDRRGKIAPGFVADLVQLDPTLIPKATWIAGQIST
jgi:N-acetylglucosamine-6-phosphate deacetylase